MFKSKSYDYFYLNGKILIVTFMTGVGKKQTKQTKQTMQTTWINMISILCAF